MTCTRAIRISRGIKAKAMTLSSWKRTFVRILRPNSRNRMMKTAKPVHHQLKSKVG